MEYGRIETERKKGRWGVANNLSGCGSSLMGCGCLLILIGCLILVPLLLAVAL